MQNIHDRVFAAIEPDIARLIGNSVVKAENLGTESPIETLLLSTMIALVHLWRAEDVIIFCRQAEQQAHGENNIICLPQYVWQNYRIDFAIFDVSLPAKYLFIECDGHDFHERTPEQAERDRSKDRLIQAFGIAILRFTGREIYRDAGYCVAQIFMTLNRLCDRRQCG